MPIAFQGLVSVCSGKRHGEKVKSRFEYVAGPRGAQVEFRIMKVDGGSYEAG